MNAITNLKATLTLTPKKKLKSTIKNKVLITIGIIALLGVFIGLDIIEKNDLLIGSIICYTSLAYLTLFAYANKGFTDWVNDDI